MKKLKTLISFMLFPILLIGCGRNAPDSIHTSEIQPQITPSFGRATEETKISTVFEKTNQIKPPTITPLMTSNVTTPLPTLSAKDAEEKYILLLNNNGNCRFPCVWGFTPGTSRDLEFHSFLRTFNEIRKDGNIQIIEGKQILETSIISRSWRNDSPDVIEYILFGINAYEQKENYKEVYFDNQIYMDYYEYYSLKNILNTYGLPENAYLDVESTIPMLDPPNLFILGFGLFTIRVDRKHYNSGWLGWHNFT